MSAPTVVNNFLEKPRRPIQIRESIDLLSYKFLPRYLNGIVGNNSTISIYNLFNEDLTQIREVHTKMKTEPESKRKPGNRKNFYRKQII